MNAAPKFGLLLVGTGLAVLLGSDMVASPARADCLVSRCPQSAARLGTPMPGVASYGVEPYGGLPNARTRKMVHHRRRHARPEADTALAGLVQPAAAMGTVMFFGPDEGGDTSSGGTGGSTQTQGGTTHISDTPEPASLVGSLIGVGMLGWFGWRRRSQRHASAAAAA